MRDSADPRANGTRIYLPSSYTGSYRYMHARYQDAMAIVRHQGRPDIFLTFTTNPTWEELTSAVDVSLRGSNSTTRVDLIARVFHLKLKRLLHLILKRHIFGRVVGHAYTVEFQKRGLPHCCLLLILHPDDKPTEATLDQFVSAKIPDPSVNPNLSHLVLQTRVHAKCGDANPGASCMVVSKSSPGKHCRFHFPKVDAETTHWATDGQGFPLYQRRPPPDSCDFDNATVWIYEEPTTRKRYYYRVIPSGRCVWVPKKVAIGVRNLEGNHDPSPDVLHNEGNFESCYK